MKKEVYLILPEMISDWKIFITFPAVKLSILGYSEYNNVENHEH